MIKTSATERLKFYFYSILIVLNLKSHKWLPATVWTVMVVEIPVHAETYTVQTFYTTVILYILSCILFFSLNTMYAIM